MKLTEELPGRRILHRSAAGSVTLRKTACGAYPGQHLSRSRLSTAAFMLLLCTLVATPAMAQTTTRDASGRIIGTTTRDINGTQTFRNGAGRMTGTATTDSNGTTTYRDGAGRIIVGRSADDDCLTNRRNGACAPSVAHDACTDAPALKTILASNAETLAGQCVADDAARGRGQGRARGLTVGRARRR